MENTSDSFMPRPLLFCLKSGRSVCYSVPDNNMGKKVVLKRRKKQRKVTGNMKKDTRRSREISRLQKCKRQM